MSIPRTIAFVTSAANLSQCPSEGLPEVAVLGRSNVGKSSLLNSLVGQELAHTSKTPGRTQLLNFFRAEFDKRTPGPERLFLVDVPGYGYAKVPHAVAQSFRGMVEPYLQLRTELRLCLLLVDPNVPVQEKDLELFRFLRHHDRTVCLVATKCDRMSGNQRVQAITRLRRAFEIDPLPYSAHQNLGREALWGRIRHAPDPVDATQP